MHKWKKCIDGDLPYCQNIYPIQQKKVKELYDYLIQDENIQSIILFGSSITPACHCDSDIDLYLELKTDKKVINRYFSFTFDIWTNYTVDKRLKSEIIKKGIKLYDRRNIV